MPNTKGATKLQKVAPFIASTAQQYNANACINAIYQTWPKSLWNDAILTSQRESSLIPNNIGTRNNNGTYDYGCMQIDSVHKSFFANGNWANPIYNCAYGYTLYQDRLKAGLNPWSNWFAVKNILWQ